MQVMQATKTIFFLFCADRGLKPNANVSCKAKKDAVGAALPQFAT
jgi:hypothetical protein